MRTKTLHPAALSGTVESQPHGASFHGALFHGAEGSPSFATSRRPSAPWRATRSALLGGVLLAPLIAASPAFSSAGASPGAVPCAPSAAESAREAAPAAAVRDFLPGSLGSIVGSRSGQPFLLVLWSLDCPPCLDEFHIFQELRDAGHSLPLVLVSTDDPERRPAVEQTLDRFGLSDIENWHFANENASRLRFEIDPRWYGEMPRTYFYGADGQRTGKSGGLEREELVAWLDARAQSISER